MTTRKDSFLDRLVQKRALARWARAARLADRLSLLALRPLRDDAQRLRREVDRVLHVADARLTQPIIGKDAIPRPTGTDWAWRPELWRGPVSPAGVAAAQNRTMLGHEVSLFHDCKVNEVTLRQIRNRRATDLAPFGLRLDVFRFDGSFLSVVVDLPPDAVQGLRQSHVIRLDCRAETERPLEMFARLNVQHGPNTEQVVRQLPLNHEDIRVEFDLAYSRIHEKRVEKAWVDLIFEGPQMNQVVLRDLTFSRRLRAEI
ncbi:hypothetical protein EOM89_07090 [Candidatus Falkowbacteria bacterium]|nr:hypothetical protein [Candidatus Falkowbacteria bacterium]